MGEDDVTISNECALESPTCLNVTEANARLIDILLDCHSSSQEARPPL